MHLDHGRTPDQMIAALERMRDQAIEELDEYLRKATNIEPHLWGPPLRVVAAVLDGIDRAATSPDGTATVVGGVSRAHVVPLAGLAALAITQSHLPATTLFTVADSVNGARAVIILYAMCTNESPDPAEVEWMGENLDALDPSDVAALACVAGRGFRFMGIPASRLIELADLADAQGATDRPE